MSNLTLIDKAFFLRRTPLFNTLDFDLLLAIADKLQTMSYEKGQTIFRVDEQAFRMFFIVKGMIDIRDSNAKLIMTLTVDEFFGEESLFSEQPRAYEAVCQTDALLLGLSHANLLSIISECPSVAVGLLQAYTATTSFRKRK